MRPVEDEEYITWAFLDQDDSTLRQFKKQDSMCEQTGLGVVYDEHGLAQPPRQVTMGEAESTADEGEAESEADEDLE